MNTIVTGTGLAVPGAGDIDELLTGSPAGAAPVDPAAILGRKGLRYSDRATQLAFCAARAALTDGGLLDGATLTVPNAEVAVVVASNLGNLGTVCRVVSMIAEEDGTAGLSPMDTPNASSNVVASAVALRFGLRGPNLMVCNGPTSGVDALRWAALMLAGRRARYALVVGVEPDDEVGRRLLGTPRLLDGAAAAVLERAGTARVRGATPRLRFGAFARESGVRACLASLGPAAGPATWYVPQTARELSEDLLPGVPRHDLSLRWGPASGALGVLQCAAAAAQLAGGAAAAYAVAGGDEDDASAGMLLLPGAVTRCGP